MWRAKLFATLQCTLPSLDTPAHASLVYLYRTLSTGHTVRRACNVCILTYVVDTKYFKSQKWTPWICKIVEEHAGTGGVFRWYVHIQVVHFQVTAPQQWVWTRIAYGSECVQVCESSYLLATGRRPEHLVKTLARFLTLLLCAGNTRTVDFMSQPAEKLSLHLSNRVRWSNKYA